MTLRTEILTLFADPTNAYVVLLAGAIMVLSEFLRPGRVLPGVGGAVLCTVSVHALLQWEWSTQGTVLLIFSSIIGISSLAAQSHVLHLICATAWVLGTLILLNGADGIHPAAALAGGAVAFCCSWLLRIARRGRIAKRT